MLTALIKTIDFVKGLRHRRLFLKISLATLILVCIGYLLGWFIYLTPQMFASGQAWMYLIVDYVNNDEIDPDAMFSKGFSGLQHALLHHDVGISQGIIESMLQLLEDDHTSYITPAQYEAFYDRIEGTYVGIGVIIAIDDSDRLIIDYTLHDSPAETEGIKAGDIIIAIDGESAEGQTIDWAAQHLRGEADTSVTLTVIHPGETGPVDIIVTREVIDYPSVYAEEIEENIVYIRLTSFSSNSADQFVAELEDLLDDETIGIIIDVRNNPGGLVSDAVTIVSQFVTAGSHVTHQVDGESNVIHTYEADEGGIATDPALRIAVLQNNNSASASEMFAGALKDLRANTQIVGQTSYGKGSINYIRELVDGSGLSISFSYWTTPNGSFVGGSGIEPDIDVEDAGEQLDAALDYIKGTP